MRIFLSLSTPMIALLVSLSMPLWAANPRWQGHEIRLGKGDDKLITTAATFFGTRSHEELVACGTLPDGRIVVFGNAWGPDFYEVDDITILGKGRRYTVSENREGKTFRINEKGKEVPARLSREYPNKSAFIAIFSSDLQAVERIFKFDWGVGAVTQAKMLADGDMLLAGRAHPGFATIVEASGRQASYPRPDPNDYGDQFDDIQDPKKKAMAIAKYQDSIHRQYGEFLYQDVRLPGDAFLLRMNADGKIKWVVTLQGYRDIASPLWLIQDRYVAFAARGPKRVELDSGEPDRAYGGTNRHRAIAFHPQTGAFYRGGDRNWGTEREPYRNPYLFCYDAAGEHQWEAYRWHSHMVGHDRFRLVSDSSVKHVLPDEDGYLWLVVWSDGGNSVAGRNPFNITAGPNRKNILGLDSWGAKIASYTHFVRWNPETADFDAYAFWASYIPQTGNPNTIRVNRFGTLADGSKVAFGRSASCLIQTKHAFVKHPDIVYKQAAMNDAEMDYGYGGSYVTVFNKAMTGLRFSSYLPGMEPCGFSDGPNNGFVLVSTAYRNGDRSNPVNSTPTVEALQDDFVGGRLDGHILLMHPEGGVE